jgi:hypothetical protein
MLTSAADSAMYSRISTSTTTGDRLDLPKAATSGMIVQRKNVPLREESQLPKYKTTHLAALTRKEFVQEAGSGHDEGESAHGEVCPVGRHVSGFVDVGARLLSEERGYELS